MTTEPEVGGLVETQLVAVRITRDQNTVITTEVLPQEVPLLQFIHGDDNVLVDDAAQTSTVLVDPNADTEFARLVSKYDRKDERMVRHVFKGGTADLREFGLQTGGLRAAKQAQSSVKVHKPAAKIGKK